VHGGEHAPHFDRRGIAAGSLGAAPHGVDRSREGLVGKERVQDDAVEHASGELQALRAEAAKKMGMSSASQSAE
jgi:hypothetical protein